MNNYLFYHTCNNHYVRLSFGMLLHKITLISLYQSPASVG